MIAHEIRAASENDTMKTFLQKNLSGTNSTPLLYNSPLMICPRPPSTEKSPSTEKVTLCKSLVAKTYHTDREHKTPACPEAFCRVSWTHFQWNLGAAASLKENAAPGD